MADNNHWDPDYDAILSDIAASNKINIPWYRLRDILKAKLNNNLHTLAPANPDHLPERPEDYQDRINAILDAFQGPPFTIQRLCELLTKPTEHHKTMIKYLRAMEKVVMVTSSFDEFPEPSLPPAPVNGTATGGAAVPESSLASTSINIITETTLEPIVFNHPQAQAQLQEVEDEEDGDKREGGEEKLQRTTIETVAADEDTLVTDADDNRAVEHTASLGTEDAPLEDTDGSSSSSTTAAAVATPTAVLVAETDGPVVKEEGVVAVFKEDVGDQTQSRDQPLLSEQQQRTAAGQRQDDAIGEEVLADEDKGDPMDMDG